MTKDGEHELPDGTLLSQGPDRSHIDGRFSDLIVRRPESPVCVIEQRSMTTTIEVLVDVFVVNGINFNQYF